MAQMTDKAMEEARAIALPATLPFVERLIRIFRDRAHDDTSSIVLGDYARVAIATTLAAKDAELAAVHQELGETRLVLEQTERNADRLAAQSAETRKALGLMLREHDILSGNFGDVVDPKHRRPDRWPSAAEAARRAIEAQGGENG